MKVLENEHRSFLRQVVLLPLPDSSMIYAAVLLIQNQLAILLEELVAILESMVFAQKVN